VQRSLIQVQDRVLVNQ